MSPAPGWLPDPARRHQLRYWDGAVWTADVADQGAPSFDPLTVPLTPPSDTSPLADDATIPRPPRESHGQVGPLPPSGGHVAGAAPSPGPGPGPGPGERQAASSRPVLLGLVLLLLAAAGAAVILLASGDDGETPTAASSTTGSPSSTTATSSTTSTTVDPTEAMVASIATGIREQASVISEAEAECAAGELVDSVGIERLQEVGQAVDDQEGVNPLELLTIEEQDTALARMRTCINPATLEQLAPGGE